jgi:sugar transferase EpsL
MLKRSFDIAVAGILLLLLSPVLLMTAFVIFLMLGSPIFFLQLRPGKYSKPFYIIKFRSMRDACDQNGHVLPDKDRLTKLGVFLRRTSLDELPELLNVLKGDMSLVGPRPLLIQYADYYTNEELVRFDVRPGITGLAQISGRNNLSWDARLQFDINYVHNQSLSIDIQILIKTFLKVIKSEDVAVDSYEIEPDLNDVRLPRKT